MKISLTDYDGMGGPKTGKDNKREARIGFEKEDQEWIRFRKRNYQRGREQEVRLEED